MKSTDGAQVRALAAGVIAAVRFDGRSLKAALPDALARLPDPRDRALCEAICFEAVRWLPRYEFWLTRLLERPLPRAAHTIHGLLLAGLAQLDAMQLADYAAISATAEAARTLRQPRLVGLVNAVLRRFMRERQALHAAAQANAEAASAHPQWLIDALQRDWPQHADALLQHNTEQAPMFLRVNLRRGSRAAYLAKLHEAGIEAIPADDLTSAALRLARPLAPTTLPGWHEGDISVQDLSAQLAAALLDVQSGQRVLDIGAAPGGKTAQILETFPELAELVALDVDAARLSRIETTLSRLQLSAICIAGDGGDPQAWWDGRPFDRILLDAPCSATGVIRRQPDIKWHRRADDIPALVAQQARLLDAAWPMLRPGGRLVYATCSVLRDENDRQIDAFLARTPSAHPLPLPETIGRPAGAGLQHFPQTEGGDGFFYAVLEKRNLRADADGAGSLH
ncbi:16S rRNA (cytosine(967)-C(5))-methyltransferase RsmB [Xanthomonadaceae bacterium JHOS43]|nr:16S rRNA (cytosine(967)-C(5))-methyltransferase RsmB [Xanthomonadaceae bacterium JHOS43]MCX7564486.1 16S rRNA (cytosine(967)-C(5))-methyltransferase RsmB [Xanthomonadaceae bacterium XH05]